ncbi:MAG: hypothetical protein KAS32_13785 [Candidatus Peribacteraceae bacterium]|nr:hypothetical protein [Candidatus Peribacteraceae bacterium]
MTNDTNHYKRVVKAMTVARWGGVVDFESFIDRERSMYGETKDDEKDLDSEVENAKFQIGAWMRSYHLNRWSNQPNYIEVWIEKKALQGVFETPCAAKSVGLAPCKGYASLTFLNEARERFESAENNGKKLIILYFGDYDPSGADIPRSIQANLGKLGVDVEVERIALNSNQIEELGLPGVPPKSTDSRTANWSGGDVVECDAVEPMTLAKMCKDAIAAHFNEVLFKELKEKEEEEREKYQAALKEYVNDLGEDIDEDTDDKDDDDEDDDEDKAEE